MRNSLLVLVVVVFCWGFSANQVAAQNLSRQQKVELRKITKTIDAAEKSYVGRNYAESKKQIETAMSEMQKLISGLDQKNISKAKKQYNRLKQAHELLTKQKQKLPKLFELKVTKKSGTDDKPKTADGISFVKQIAPILNSKCGRCHVRGTSGGFSLANYEVLMKGPRAGKVIFEGKPDDSRIIEVIEEGDMPRGGLTVSETELKTLKTWIKEGAKFDGDTPTASLNQLAGGNNRPRRERLEVKAATGKNKVSFSSELAPIIVEKCSGCHLGTQRIRGGLNLGDFRGLLRGGDSGNVIKPGSGKDSILVKRLLGEGGGQRMPAGSAPLSKTQIQKFITWIDEGAPFDGGDPRGPMGRLAALAKARNASHEELSADRAKLAVRNWKTVMTDTPFNQLETDNFLLISEFDKATLEKFGKVAETQAAKISKLMKMSSKSGFIKGRMTLFIFKRRYDYSEFGKMIERRELPRTFKGHWGYTVTDAYAAILTTRTASPDEFGLILSQQIGAVAMSSTGADVPTWFADGVGHWLTAKNYARDDTVKKWKSDAAKYAQSMSKPDDFIKGTLPEDQAALVSYYFVDLVNKSSSRFTKFVATLRNGKPFEEAFESAWGSKPEAVLKRLTGAPQKSGKGKGKRRRK